MTLRQINAQLSCPFSVGDDDAYAWTSVFYIDSSDLQFNSAAPAYFVSRLIQTYTERVTIEGYNVVSAPGSTGVIYEERFTPTRHGGVPDLDEGYTLLSCARWRIFTTGRPSYKLHRLPFRDSDIAGDVFTTEGFNRSQGAANNWAGDGVWRNRYGDLITGIVVAPDVRMWQLRHGTRRRSRPPITLPV